MAVLVDVEFGGLEIMSTTAYTVKRGLTYLFPKLKNCLKGKCHEMDTFCLNILSSTYFLSMR